MTPLFNTTPMTNLAHSAVGFDKVLHIAHFEWHGIRQAAAYAPGHKLLIPGEADLETEQTAPNGIKDAIVAEIERMGITHIVAQGYSDNMDTLILYLRAKFGGMLKVGVINHVTTGQFDNAFEMRMLALLFSRKGYGVIDRIASVKPNFGAVFPDIWDKVIFNYAPNIPKGVFSRATDVASVFSPLDVGWRKNMYTNILAAILAENVDEVCAVNYPMGLENITDLSKVKLVGYLRGNDLLAEMARNRLVLLATFAECQPMTQLEAFAVGTPSLTRELSLDLFAKDELIRLCSTHALDDPAALSKDISRIVDAGKDTDHMQQMIEDHLNRRHALASERYAEFLGL